MPVHIKLIVSGITLAVGAAFFYFERAAGEPRLAVIGGCLAIFMVIAMWVFPETGNKGKR